jgi:hypothetical protein
MFALGCGQVMEGDVSATFARYPRPNVRGWKK